MFLFHAVHLPYGFLGVDLFFVLSGFLITRNLVLADMRDPRWIERRRSRFAWALSLSASAYALCAAMLPGFKEGAYLPFALVAVAMPSLLALVRSGTLERVLCLPVLRYVGTISYTCYLVHDIALERLHALHLPGAVTVALAFALTIGFATLSWYALEQPLGRLRGRVRVVPAC